MSAPHPNKAKMEAAVQRWIAEVQGRPNARTLLLNKADMVERFLADLSRCTRPGHTGALPHYLVGLTAFDLTAAHGDLLIAAGRMAEAA